MPWSARRCSRGPETPRCPLARGEATPEMTQVLVLTDQLDAELPDMLAEHRSIVQALDR